MWNIPNTLTTFRLFLIPIFLVIFYLPFSWAFFAAAFVFWLASITDILDGYLARRLNQSTPFGAFLDPVADKVMVCAALVALSSHYQTLYMTIPALVIISREIVISALREWMAELGNSTSVAVSYVGKLKTTFQMVAITVLLLNWESLETIGYALMVAAVILTLWSMMIYLKAAWPYLKRSG